MDRLQKDTILVALVEKLKEHGSWCGETHIQKSTFFLQELAGVDLGFDFILYKHGPYSFELTDELTSMRADSLLEVVIQPAPYGPRLLPTEAGANLKDRYWMTLEESADSIERVAGLLGGKGVADLERLATALYVTRNATDDDPSARASEVVEIKPHISHEDALNAVQSVDKWAGEAKKVLVRAGRAAV